MATVWVLNKAGLLDSHGLAYDFSKPIHSLASSTLVSLSYIVVKNWYFHHLRMIKTWTNNLKWWLLVMIRIYLLSDYIYQKNKFIDRSWFFMIWLRQYHNILHINSDNDLTMDIYLDFSIYIFYLILVWTLFHWDGSYITCKIILIYTKCTPIESAIFQLHGDVFGVLIL